MRKPKENVKIKKYHLLGDVQQQQRWRYQNGGQRRRQQVSSGGGQRYQNLKHKQTNLNTNINEISNINKNKTPNINKITKIKDKT